VEAKVGEVRMAEAIEERKKEEKEKEKAKERKKNRSTKYNRRMGDLGEERGSSKVRDRSKEAGSRKISQVNSHLWQKN